jgi:aminoglycoside/choline kinase family phosphotransferase
VDRKEHLPLPIAIDEITRDWLTAAFRTKAPGVTVRAFEIVDVVRSTCTKIRLRLDLDEAGRSAGIPERVILKGGFEAHARELAHMHEREVRGYRDVFPVLPLPAPTCHFADYDPERRQGIVIMDDLVARGVTFCSALKPQTYEQVARRLGVLARFHARSWNSPELEPGGRWCDLVDFFDVMRAFFDRSVAPATWQRFITSPRGAAVSVRFHDRDWMVAAWDRLSAFSRRLPHCVLHGDVHLGNLYIEPDGTPGFLDTLASRGPGMLEVSYHVSASVDVADRPRWEGALVQHYLDELACNGVETPGFDEAMRQYGILLLYGYFIWITTESHYQPESVNTANAARVSAAMLDHDTLGLLESIGRFD